MKENEKAKSNGKRLEEIEKLKAELDRSLAVAQVKASHKQIEEIEKLRKRPIAFSIRERITSFVTITKPLLDTLSKPEFSSAQMREAPMKEESLLTFENLEKTYISIRYDFQKNLDIGEKSMVKMFPAIKLRKDNLDHLVGDLINVDTQLSQMANYCERFLT